MELTLHKIPKIYLTSWCTNFVEMHSFRTVSGELSGTLVDTVHFYKISTPGN